MAFEQGSAMIIEWSTINLHFLSRIFSVNYAKYLRKTIPVV